MNVPSRGLWRPLRTSLLAAIWFLAAAAQAQSRWQAPPEPLVKPHITRSYPEDPQGNRIADALLQKARQVTAAQANQMVDVRLVFTRQITQNQINDFENLGGRIDYIYQAVSYGWNGKIPLGKATLLPQLLGDDLILVREPKPLRTFLLNATLQGRARAVWATNYFGFASGFSGSNDTTIGILDTGVDSTHEDLANRCLYWKDQSTDDLSTNKDIVQHGTHVAGIALGTGAASGNAAGPLAFTLEGSFGTNAGDGVTFIEPLMLATNSLTWSAAAKWDGGGITSVELDSSPAGKNHFTTLNQTVYYSPSGFTNTFTPTLTNIYMSAVESGVSGNQVTNYVITNHLSYYPSAGDGFNRLRGVAPGCNYVAEKIFTDAGANLDTWTEAAIDDLVAKRTTYNVKVMNLSIGGGGTDTTLREDVNNAVNDGVVMVVSAGNDGASGGAISDPGGAAMAITVAAANSQIQLTDYSSLGFTNPASASGQQQDYKPDLMAPGGSQYYGGILSADSNSGDGTAYPDQMTNDYTILFGTSMSSPFVAGAAALIIEAMEANGNSWNFTSSADASLVKTVICATTTESNTNRELNANNPTLQRAAAGPNGYPVGKDPDEGYGMINVDAAIQAVQQNLVSGFTTNYSLGGSNTAARAFAGHFADNGRPVYASLTVPAGADFDLYLYSSSPGTYGDPVILASSTQAGSGVSESFAYRPSTAGTNYLVVKSISGSGSFSLVISNFSNDNFTNAMTISGVSGSTIGTNKSFTTETSEPLPTGGFDSAWYSWTAPASGYAAFVASNAIPTLYTGSTVSSLAKLSGQSAAATNVVTVSSGTTYYVQVCATNSAGTNFLLSWSLFAPTYAAVNATNLSIPVNSSPSPYPATVVIPSLLGTITKATVTFSNYSFSGAANCVSLLVSPRTNSIALMVGSGDQSTFTNLQVTFADAGVAPPSASVLTSGVYQCTCPEAFLSFDSPAPARPYSTNLSDVIGESPGGTWSLYAEAGGNAFGGSISNWSLNLTLDIVPSFSISPAALNYTNGVSLSNVVGSATISSPYYANLSGGSLTAQFTTNGATGDTLSLQNQGTGAGQIGAAGGVVSYGGVSVGVYAGGANGATPLVVSFTNSAATLAVVQQLITNIVFGTTSSSTSTRTVEFTLADANGGSTNASASVNVTVANHAPVVANALSSQTATYGGKFSLTFATNVFTDADAGQTLTYTANGLPSGVSLTNAARTFGGYPSQSGTYSVGLVATDNGTPPLSATDTFTLTIAKAALTLTSSNASRVYGATNPVFTGLLTGVTNSDNITAAYICPATTNSAPGTYAISTSLVDPNSRLTNYAVTTNTGTLTVSKTPVTITSVSVSRAYGATNPVFAVTYTGLTNGQTLATSGISGSPDLTSAATTNSPAGSYVITNATGTLASSDYSFITSNGTLVVTQALLTVTASNVYRPYGAANPVLGAGYTGFVNGQNLGSSGVTGSPTLATAATTNSAPGAYVITNLAGTLAAANYAFALSNGTLTVTQAVLVVSANPAVRGYGAGNPVFTVSYSGFANGQSLATSDVAGAPSLKTAATSSSAVGVYVITNSTGTLASADYSFTYSNSTLTVTQASLAVTAANASRVYGQANPVLTGTIVGITNNDNISASYSTTATAASPVGSYPITATLNDPGLALGNYSVITNQGALTITNARGPGTYLVTLSLSNSVIALATNGTLDYTFTDPDSGLAVVVAVTMSPYSSVTNDPVFTLLDTYGYNRNPVHLGIDSGLGGGDGNWVDSYEGVNFSASLVSASSGVITNSLEFGVTGIGIRPSSGSLIWIANGTTNSVNIPGESLVLLSTNLPELAGTTYVGELRNTSNGGQYQLSDLYPTTGQSIVFGASFFAGSGAPVVTLNPAGEFACSGNSVVFTAAAVGYPAPTVQWQVEADGGGFINLSGATNTVLDLTPDYTANGNQYQAVFANSAGTATTVAAVLTVSAPLSPPVISIAATTVLEDSTNTAAGPAGEAVYSWSITNAVILGATNSQSVTYVAGASSEVGLELTVGNVSGCTTSSSTNVAIVLPSGETPYVSYALTNNQFLLTVTGTAGANYVVQVTTNLATPNWISVATNAAPFTFVISNTIEFPQQYYRGMVAP